MKGGGNMGIQERLLLLRQKMEENKITMYFVPTNDFHGSEYISDYFKAREYMSGFTGSAGALMVTPSEAVLWTDGRYFIQAERQLKGTEIELYKMGQENVPTVADYIRNHCKEGQVLGVDGRMVSQEWKEKTEEILKENGAFLKLSKDLVGEIWNDRPAFIQKKAWILEEKFAGESRERKIEKLREQLKEWKADGMLLTALDEIAWLLNIRGNDIPCNPVVFSYVYISQKICILFSATDVWAEEDRKQLENSGVTLSDYQDIYRYVETFPQRHKILIDKSTMNARIVDLFPEKTEFVDKVSPIVFWKAIKNPTEVENEREAHRKDGVALTKFIYWLKHNISHLPLTERTVANKLEEFRKAQKNYLEPSFETIAGYGANGAIVHYSATEETDTALQPENFLLLDSGGQYLEGTTDVTRTIFLGEKATKEQKKYYTAVLRGNLNLLHCKFMYGCSGVSLDYAARKPLWDMGCDYNHGTGHGVGYLLNVHEGPNAFRYRTTGQGMPPLEEGMITSDEPGIYLEGKYGIRLENLIVCVKKERNGYGQFMGFEALTMAPFEREAIDTAQMSEEEKKWLNEYHRKVYETIAPYLEQEEREWLADECREMM